MLKNHANYGTNPRVSNSAGAHKCVCERECVLLLISHLPARYWAYGMCGNWPGPHYPTIRPAKKNPIAM